MRLPALFRKFSVVTAAATASPYAFVLAVGFIGGWASVGPRYKWSDSHSLFVNTVTTIVSFLMGFVLQNTQSREMRALHLKVDELVRALATANNRLIGIEDVSDEEMAAAAGFIRAARLKAPPPTT